MAFRKSSGRGRYRSRFNSKMKSRGRRKGRRTYVTVSRGGIRL